MHYLSTAGIFILITICVIALAWWNGRTPAYLQNTLFGAGAVLGSWALILAIVGSTIGFKYELSAFILFIILWIWPWKSTFNERLAALRAHATHGFIATKSLRGAGVILALYLCVAFVITFVLSLAPPAGNDYDSLVYHLSVPMQYLMAGKVVALPYDHHSFFPLTMEMLYLCALQLSGQLSGAVLAKLFHWLMLPLSCLALIAMGDKLQSRRSGLWAAAIFVSIPLVLFESTTAYIDLGLVFFALLSFLCLFNWLEKYQIQWLIGSGIFGGFCLGIKYSGVFIPFFIGLWLLGTMAKRRRWQPAGIGIYILCIIAVSGFWYGKNEVQTRNPVYPFAYSIFDGKGWNAQMAKDYSADQHEYGFGRKPLDWLMLPWRVSMAPLNDLLVTDQGIGFAPQPFWPFSSAQITPRAGIANGRFEVMGLLTQSLLGPLLLALCIPLIFVRRKPVSVGFALWAFAFFFLLWAIGSQQIRYLLAPVALLCLAAGWMVELCQKRSASIKWVTIIAVSISCIFSPIYLYAQSSGSIPVITGQITPSQYLQRSFPGYNAMQWANENTSQNAIFAIYGEPRCFYLQRKYFWADDPHNNLIDYAQITTGHELMNALKAQGASYILWNTEPGKTGGVFSPPPQMQEAIDEKLAQEIYAANGYKIFVIK